jgi:hypothetical protein
MMHLQKNVLEELELFAWHNQNSSSLLDHDVHFLTAKDDHGVVHRHQKDA